MSKIHEIYAFISDAEGDGIVGIQTGSGHLMQAVSSDMKLIEMMRPMVDCVSRQTGKTITLRKFRLVDE